jgi:hypothetical protein
MSEIIPSKQTAEQAIAGMADIVRELNELRAFKADADARYARQDEINGIVLGGLIEDKRELLAERARMRAKWASVPWEAMDLTLAGFMQMVEEFGYKLHPDDAKMVDVMLTHAVLLGNWYRANAPKEAAE